MDLEVQVVVRRPARVADERDDVARLDALADLDEQLGIVVIDGIHEKPCVVRRESCVVLDRHRQRAPLCRPRMHYDTSANRVHRRSVGVVELDSLMRLEVAAHRRAETISLVYVGLIGERDGAAEPRVPGRPWAAGSRRRSMNALRQENRIRSGDTVTAAETGMPRATAIQ